MVDTQERSWLNHLTAPVHAMPFTSVRSSPSVSPSWKRDGTCSSTSTVPDCFMTTFCTVIGNPRLFHPSWQAPYDQSERKSASPLSRNALFSHLTIRS